MAKSSPWDSKNGDGGLPLLFVGQHGLGDGELVSTVSPQHVLGHPGHHVQALLSCTRRSYSHTFAGSCSVESEVRKRTHERSLCPVEQVPPGSVLEQAAVAMVHRAQILGDGMSP